jgi:hypothetical protein
LLTPINHHELFPKSESTIIATITKKSFHKIIPIWTI